MVDVYLDKLKKHALLFGSGILLVILAGNGFAYITADHSSSGMQVFGKSFDSIPHVKLTLTWDKRSWVPKPSSRDRNSIIYVPQFPYAIRLPIPYENDGLGTPAVSNFETAYADFFSLSTSYEVQAWYKKTMLNAGWVLGPLTGTVGGSYSTSSVEEFYLKGNANITLTITSKPLFHSTGIYIFAMRIMPGAVGLSM